MIKNSLLILGVLVLVTSCVSPKVYKDLESKYASLKQENRKLSRDNEKLMSWQNEAKNELKELKTDYEAAVAERDKLRADYNATKSNLDALKASYTALEKNSSDAIARNSQKNRELLADLEAKEQALAAENARLQKLNKALEERSNRIAELENVIASKDAAMTQLKNAISRALTDFEGKGLTVEQRGGKVYVSMENKLLFESGSWAVGTDGQTAVRSLGNVLAENQDIAVLIEGHTDNTGSDELNVELSKSRAGVVMNYLIDQGVDKKRLASKGFGGSMPVADNRDEETRQLNRRVEFRILNY